MGFFKSVHELQKQAKEIDRDWDRKAMRENAVSRMAGMQEMMAEQTRAANISATGLPATATVVSAQKTNQQVNFDPVLELELTVFPEGGPPYPVSMRQVVSQLYLAKVQAGASLAAKVDPEDEQSVWLDLARS